MLNLVKTNFYVWIQKAKGAYGYNEKHDINVCKHYFTNNYYRL